MLRVGLHWGEKSLDAVLHGGEEMCASELDRARGEYVHVENVLDIDLMCTVHATVWSQCTSFELNLGVAAGTSQSGCGTCFGILGGYATPW